MFSDPRQGPGSWHPLCSCPWGAHGAENPVLGSGDRVLLQPRLVGPVPEGPTHGRAHVSKGSPRTPELGSAQIALHGLPSPQPRHLSSLLFLPVCCQSLPPSLRCPYPPIAPRDQSSRHPRGRRPP